MTGEMTQPGARRWVSLAAICMAAGLVWLAFADLGVAIPLLADEFGADHASLAWANNAFSLVTGALVIAGGRFGDIFGRRRMLLIGIVLFAAFSVVAALAPNIELLILGRGLMGIGAAAILPATLALIPPQFSGATLLTAFGVWQAVAWGGQAIGPTIGGVLSTVLGWSWLFWINVPLAILAFVLIRFSSPESKDDAASRRIDWAGLAAIGLAAFALLFALTEGPDAGWASPVVIGGFLLAIVLGAAWWLIESRVTEPLVDLSLFRLRHYDGALTANLTMNLAFGGLSYLLVLWLQNARGYGAIEAGLLMLPATVGIFLFIPLGGRLDARRGGRFPVLIGLVVMAAGLLLLGFLSADSGLILLMSALVVIGLGLGLLSTPISNAAVGDVPVKLAGAAAGVFKMSSMVGGALGVALLSGLARGFAGADSDRAMRDAGLSAEEIEQARQALVDSTSFQDAIASLSADLQKAVTDAVIAAFSTGVAWTMITIGIATIVVTVLVALIWPRRRASAADSGSA